MSITRLPYSFHLPVTANNLSKKFFFQNLRTIISFVSLSVHLYMWTICHWYYSSRHIGNLRHLTVKHKHEREGWKKNCSQNKPGLIMTSEKQKWIQNGKQELKNCWVLRIRTVIFLLVGHLKVINTFKLLVESKKTFFWEQKKYKNEIMWFKLYLFILQHCHTELKQDW